MTSDFSINTNFSTEQFNNSITNFNKNFDSSFKNTVGRTTDDASDFDKVFNSIS